MPPQDEFTTRPMRDLPSALEKQQEITRQLAERKPAVFLDYDGTLTPIVARPEYALLPDQTREVLERLKALCVVAIISGRDLADVRSMVGIEGITYAGSHGFDILAVDGSQREQEQGKRFLPALGHAETELQQLVKDIPGAWVECKRFAIAVHYRAVEDAHVPELERRVTRVATQQPDLRKSGGKKVFELRPNIEWDKGKALLSLLESLGVHSSEAVPLFIGDDVTDEDAFRAIREIGIGIVVGRDERETAARYALDDTNEVRAFLSRLVIFLEGSPK